MIWIVLVLLAVVAVLPFLLERRRPDMDDDLRAQAPGQFAKLGDGRTHYQWRGAAKGPVLVCIHGLTTPSYVFDWMIDGLGALGFRVLSYDIYGRGFSDRPRGAQTRSFFIRQLRELLQDQEVTDGFSLLGYSMGGGIATVFAAEEPTRVKRLILLAPAGLMHAPGFLSEFARRVPLLGDWLMLCLGGAELRRGARIQPAHSSVVRVLARRQAEETQRRGYLPAVLSSQRNLLGRTLEEEHREIAKQGVPVLAIWGELDDVIPIQAMGRLAECNRAAHHQVIKGAGHGLPYTHPDEVLRAIDLELDGDTLT
jgi:pimeloyl-ACP methyl ester carboxylesterase